MKVIFQKIYRLALGFYANPALEKIMKTYRCDIFSYLAKILFISFLLPSYTPSAIAQEDGINLEPLQVSSEQLEETEPKTVTSNEKTREIMTRTPGGIALVENKEFSDKYSLNFEDTLALTPGVFAQKRFGEEVRLSIRGSGLSRGFHLRGLTLLQDGIPFNLADSSADFQEADPISFERLEVYKGANGLQYGGASLGGAINMITKTGFTQSGNQLRMEMGSDATYRVNMQSGGVFDNSDAFLNITGTTSDGFRQHEDQENIKLNTNIGLALSDAVETRFYLSGNIINQDLPGTVDLATALNSPRRSDQSAIQQKWARDIRSLRVSNKTTIEIGEASKVDIGGFINGKDLYHPITAFVGVIDQQTLDYGIFSTITGDYDTFGKLNNYRLGFTTHSGSTDAKLYKNEAGTKGAIISDSEQSSDNGIIFGENSLFLNNSLAIILGGQLVWSKRQIEDEKNVVPDDRAIFRTANPKVGLLYETSNKLQLYTNLSKSFEAPTFSELTQGGAANFVPVDAQDAWTAEIGTRKNYGESLSWDISLYRAWINGELLQFTPAPGIPAATFNADKTIHQGVELGTTIRLIESIFLPSDKISWRHSYTFSDYQFKQDLQYANNRIPGQPRNFYQSELRYDSRSDWFFAFNWEASDKADVDFTNTVTAPGYGIIGANAGLTLAKNIDLFFEGRNLLDRRFVSTFSTIVNANGNASSPVFYPGDGQRFFSGFRFRW